MRDPNAVAQADRRVAPEPRNEESVPRLLHTAPGLRVSTRADEVAVHGFVTPLEARRRPQEPQLPPVDEGVHGVFVVVEGRPHEDPANVQLH